MVDYNNVVSILRRTLIKYTNIQDTYFICEYLLLINIKYTKPHLILDLDETLIFSRSYQSQFNQITQVIIYLLDHIMEEIFG